MKKLFVTFTLLLGGFCAFADRQISYQVAPSDITIGYVIEKVWLDEYSMPAITISDLSYLPGAVLPENAIPSDPAKFDIILGKERKRPFALVRVPVYSSGDNHTIRQLSAFTLTIATQKPANQPLPGDMARTTASNSVLANGTWYKIAVSGTGLHKIDYNFISSQLGKGNINSNSIRVFGNGGVMLSENNAVPRQNDLTENAIWINDGGDGTFGPGDYLVFYAIGPTGWEADNANKKFIHKKNLYEDKAYYFLNFDEGAGKRIGTQAGGLTANTTATTFDAYALHEEDLYNPGQFGKTWWGELFGLDPGQTNSHKIDIDLGAATDSARFRILLGSRSPAAGNTFTLSLNGQQMGAYTLGPAAQDDDDIPVSGLEANWALPFNSSTASINLTYQPGISSGKGYLNFIEVNYRRPLAFTGSGLTFRDWRTTGAGNVTIYQLGNAGGETQVWDVTDPYNPVKMNGSLNGSTYSFTQESATLHEFAAMKDAQLDVPQYIGTVANQNLHGAGPADYLIVTHPDFLSAAQSLADFHVERSNMRVVVATTNQIYNEFSSGSQDVSAIRDFARMFYENAGMDTNQMPKYLLLMGDASYDYKDRVANNSNYVPTFEAAESYNLINSFCNDDFFAFLDDNEDIENTKIANTLDVGVGRFPVVTNTDAMLMVKKIKHYKDPASLGPWRLSTTFVADNEDNAGPHMEDGEIMDSVVRKNSNIYNASKIYEDAIPMISTPGGARAPEANKAINDQIFKGTLLVNYNGHGNTQVLSHERILTQDDFNSWKNYDKMPFMVTATCDFGRFDHPDYVSSGEKLFLKGDGGVIAILTTTQLVYQFANRTINEEFIDAQFQHVNGKWNTFGDAFRIAKNETYKNIPDVSTLVNFRKFALLGDPALEPNFPQYFIHTTSVRDGVTLEPVDSIGALGSYVIDGKVTDVNGNVLEGFNGRLSVTFFDKARTVETISGINKTFVVRNNIVYKGKATVANGRFSFAFVAPKDINYNYGEGKISYYAENGVTDAAGADFDYVVGGFSDHPVVEDDAPTVRPYINDSLFRNGGITSNNTKLFVILEDETGINVSGNNVGHDLTAVLDGDIQHPFVLNDYYETAPNTYKKGFVTFPITGLSDGQHTLRVKAWDVNNNSGEGTVAFEVVNGGIVKMQNLINYPNPFSDITHFRFEHNQPEEPLAVEIHIYNTNGMMVRKLKQNYTPSGSRSHEITWDGTDNNGAKLPSAVYPYRFIITTEKGTQTSAYQKLVLIR